ncbi:MAG TPA: L-fucokinase [Acidobacteriota bacterium]|nr:L-fucokinase [Acidobacteriota bacterium]
MPTSIDWLILTAANRAQARGYEAQLKARSSRRALSGVARWRVVPDPEDRRVGSGGSTLWVLFELACVLGSRHPDAKSLADLFAGRRILIIHSGGDSRRLCAYAAQGKIFIPLPADTDDGCPAALFDLVLKSLVALPAPESGQLLIASGDVLLTFDPAAVDFSRAGVTGVAYPGPIERGTKHGVYVADRDGRVRDFLQKPDEETARRRGAVDTAGRVLVDTGLLSLNPATAESWLAAAGVRMRQGRVEASAGIVRDLASSRCPSLDLYEQFAMAMVPVLDQTAYLRRIGAQIGADESHRRRMAHLYRAFHEQPFYVNVLPYCEFFHIGSSRELLSNIGVLNRTARSFGFSNFHRSSVAERASLEGSFVYNCILGSKQITAGDGALLEAVHTDQPLHLPGRNIVVGYPKEARKPLRLPEGHGLVCLPLQSGHWSAVQFEMDEDFKASGRWEKSLWPVGPIDDVLAALSGLASSLPRVSLAKLMLLVDHDRMIQQRDEIRRLAELHTLGDRLDRDPWLPASQILSLVRSREDSTAALKQIDTLLCRGGDFLQQARLFELAHVLHQKYRTLLPSRPKLRGQALERAAFNAVAGAVAEEIDMPMRSRRFGILPDQVVWVTCPVRIDFTGGWSDTPPICVELGGAVVNAAVTLNGQYPVQVMAKVTDSPLIRLTSLDLGQHVDIAETPGPGECQNPADWSALPKAALILSGICPSDPKQPLKKWLERLGGGLDITLFSALPKGSGLGTSSILGASVLACLARVLDEPVSRDSLITRTSNLEQVMTTGGGWQDQIGGITPGVKLIRTVPGVRQIPALHWIPFDMTSSGPLRPRLLLYYTGYKRMAKHILQKVVARYLSRDPAAIGIIHRLKAEAEKMEAALASGDVDAFGRGVECYWELKKALDPGSTNEKIEALLKPLGRYLIGKLLPGAGGGGFVFMVARDAECAARVRQILEREPPNKLARFFDFDIDQKGLSVTVL